MSNSENIKIKKTISIYKKEIVLMIIAIGLLLFNLANLIIINYKKNYVPTIMYRTYTKEKGWTKWSKNGDFSGDGVNPILNIEIKVKANIPALINYEVYQNNKWRVVEFLGKKNKIKNNEIYAIKSVLTSDVENEYEIFYRTCVKDKCYGWGNSLTISGNKKKPITKIQMKILSKKSKINDMIKDYKKSEKISEGFEK